MEKYYLYGIKLHIGFLNLKLHGLRPQPNSKVLAEEMIKNGFNLVSGGTDNHLILVDLTSREMTGLDAETALGKAGIVANKNTIPFETKNPQITSGLRIGTPAVTTRGFKENEIKIVASLITRVLENINDNKVLDARADHYVLPHEYTESNR